MSDLSEKLAAIEARLGATRSGPWLVNDEEQTVRVESAEGGVWVGEIMYDRSGEHSTCWVSEFRPDAEFIAAARDDVPFLLALVREQAAKLAKVEALHVAEGNGCCIVCWDFNNDTDVKWHCPTVTAIGDKDV